MITEIHAVHTPCKNCVFATYENNTQVGCALNYIERLKNSGAQVLEAYDDEKEFYIINEKKCLGYRETSWLKKFDLENAPLDEQINQFKSLNTLSYLTIVNLKGFENISDLEEVCIALANHNNKPEKIIFVRHREDAVKQYSFSAIDDIIKKSKLSCIWRLQSMIDDGVLYEDLINNIILLNAKYRFVLTINSKPQNLEIVSKAYNIVYENFDQFIVLSNKEKNCFMFGGAVYRFAYKDGQNILSLDDKHIVV